MLPSPKPERMWIWTSIGLILIGLWLAYKYQFLVLDFTIESPSDVVGKMTPPFLAAVFVERALEVFMTIYRARESNRLQMELTQLPDGSLERAAKERELLQFKAESQRVAFWAAFAMGVLLAAAGVRALEPFLRFTPLHAFSVQEQVFAALDVLLTGAVIAGGSDGIHKMTSLITDWLDKSRALVNQASPNQGPTLMAGVSSGGASSPLLPGGTTAPATPANHIFDTGA